MTSFVGGRAGNDEHRRLCRRLRRHGGHLHQLTSNDDFFPEWAPNGKKIAFTRDSTGAGGFGEIYKVNTDGSGLQGVVTGPNKLARGPSWRARNP